MAMVCCILGKFLGVVCHCFPARLDVPTFAARCLHVRNDARDLSSERWNYGRERLSGNFAYIASLFTPLGIFYKSMKWDRRLYFPSEGRCSEEFFAEFEPANVHTKGQHATPRPPKPLQSLYNPKIYKVFHSVFAFFILFSQQTENIPLCSMNRFVIINDMDFVYCAVRADAL
jgi:hypothetical protein